MPEYTESQIRELSGRELWAAVEWLCFGDDLTAKTDSRINDAVLHFCSFTVGRKGLLGSVPCIRPIRHGKWIGPPIEVESLLNGKGYQLWSLREGQPWQSDLEQHVASYRGEPRNFGSLDVCVPLLIGEGGVLEDYHFGWSRVFSCYEVLQIIGDLNDEFCSVVASADDPATAICRAACLVALREGE